ncbi:SprT family zinc-dependent metalloprotease [Roseicyclus sp. F158]|uniref:SprT family zinc-dependent metalloprotease n=1 Tax=Tropicimonas omnivorans TaxID=3075590 RepID=A0ABU3DDJ4_9RHOB|nr:SprT family zinc-dependent metalloprotease [Roseicyclus sp. F158]MDT0681767.1 SprT family zinc-dependent metalloprotease [Roseicyclus sp. F158]
MSDGIGSVPLLMRRSARARRVTLRVSALDGRVTLTLPARMAEREALDFARGRLPWIRDALKRAAPQHDVILGAAIPVEGRTVQIAEGSRAGVTEEHLCVRKGSAPGPAARAVLRTLARERLAAASDRYAAALGRPYSRIALRDTRSRWGSCSSSGTLSYSWRLIMAPPVVLDYVAAHEVCHLQEMNHSDRYWALVRDLMPGFEAPRAWLKTQGQALHGWRFDAEAPASD